MGVGILKVSIYEFNDLTVTHAIIQFEGDEVGKLLKVLRGLDAHRLRRLVEDAFGREVFDLCLALGMLIHKDVNPLDTAYLRVEFDDGSYYTLEVYEESARLVSNSRLKQVYDFIKTLMEILRIKSA